MILLLALGISVLWACWTARCLALNCARARKLGVPLVIVPISSMNVLWIVLQPPIIALLEKIHGPSKLTRFGSRDWHFREKSRPHLEIGDAFAIVTPGEIWLNIADPDAIVDIFQRRTQFIRPVELYQMLNVFGHNAATVGWAQWKQQRKIIAAPFNERTNHLVWTESINQARDMMEELTCVGSKEKAGLQTDTRAVALNVLAATGFNRKYKFARGQDEMSGYRGALSTLMDNSLFMMLVPRGVLCSRLAPRSWAKIGQASQSFEKYMLNLLHQEKELLAQGKPGASILTSSLLRASQDFQQSKALQDNTMVHSGPSATGLTINELLGNIFLINFAGHDTTANSLAYAILHLAMHPEVQDWIREELHMVVGQSQSKDWDYESIFPMLKRPLAVMYETLRLFPPIMALPKYTSNEAQELSIGSNCITVPPRVYVVPSLLAMHTHPKYWGPDALTWRPSRWINAAGEFLVPQRGTYFPWSEGPQNCPGRKFARVEFVAVLATLFHKLRVQPVCGKGENPELVQKRLQEVVNEVSHGVLLRMKDADSVKLSWTSVEQFAT